VDIIVGVKIGVFNFWDVAIVSSERIVVIKGT
jgi:hypothetical protein